jgi:hypothetical protein
MRHAQPGCRRFAQGAHFARATLWVIVAVIDGRYRFWQHRTAVCRWRSASSNRTRAIQNIPEHAYG